MSRSDRDQYVEILWSNITSGKEHNFKTYIEAGTPGTEVAQFNFNSIMMYSSTSFGNVIDGVAQQTIRRRDGLNYYVQRSYLADTDVVALRAIYGPPYVRAEKGEVYYNRYWDEYGDYMSDREWPVYAKFYQDKACTVPAVLTTPRYLNISGFVEYGSGGVTPFTRTVVVPAGATSVQIGMGSLVIHEIEGSLVEYSEEDCWIVNY